MKKRVKTLLLQDNTYIECSEGLRKALESEIDILYFKNFFSNYTTRHTGFAGTDEFTQLLWDNLICEENYVLSEAAGDLSKGIRTWFNMYYDDRISVMEKFRDCYFRSMPQGALLTIDFMPLVFCKFLMDELISILASPQWQLLNNRIHLN